MAPQDDYQDLLKQQRFLEELEQGIRFANREIINKHIPVLNKDTILGFAVSVGRLRGLYLQAAFEMAVNDHGEMPELERVDQLRERRKLYEEARSAFEALSDALKKGYIDLEWGDGQ